MKKPRIYTYKITFEGTPFWYWGVHKEKKYGELYLGSPTTHKWAWDFYTPKIQILQEFPYTEQGWKDANSIEQRCIFPDLNNPLCLNESCNRVLSFKSLSLGGKKGSEILHSKYPGFASDNIRKTMEKHPHMKGQRWREGVAAAKIKNSKKVICIETQEVFESSLDVFRKTGISAAMVRKCCTGKSKMAGGFHWSHVSG